MSSASTTCAESLSIPHSNTANTPTGPAPMMATSLRWTDISILQEEARAALLEDAPAGRHRSLGADHAAAVGAGPRPARPAVGRRGFRRHDPRGYARAGGPRPGARA